MKFEVLKRSHLKRNLLIGVVAILIISAVVLNFTRAKYRTAQSMPLINGTVNYDLADLNVVAVYIQDELATDGYIKSDTIPTEGYTFNEEMSYCTVDGNRDDNITLEYDIDTQTLNVAPLISKGTKCYLYFDEQTSIKDTLLAYYPTILTRTSFNSTVTNTTTGTIYKSADSSQYDENGEVYYFAGNPTDNWVSFARFYWRIIRINGDGSIRLIYQGTSTNANGSETQIGTSAFNSSYEDNMYAGYMYKENQVHGSETSSTIKELLDDWYYENLFTNYDDYINKEAGFCNDRTLSTGTGIGTTVTNYAAYYRLLLNKTPAFKCGDEVNDLYTVAESGNGNNALTYPIGLITADEVSYAGGASDAENQSYYLYTGQTYWTMSPLFFEGFGINVFRIYPSGYLGADYVNRTYGVRPVINLRSDVTISSGNGTSGNPFVIE